MTEISLKPVDHTAMKVNQITIIVLNLVAFVINPPWLAAIVAAFLLVGTVIEIDASLQPELASQWGVVSVPTTFILDSQGQPKHVNHGLTSAEKLLKQLNEI
jgi:hypothetical protein